MPKNRTYIRNIKNRDIEVTEHASCVCRVYLNHSLVYTGHSRELAIEVASNYAYEDKSNVVSIEYTKTYTFKQPKENQ